MVLASPNLTRSTGLSTCRDRPCDLRAATSSAARRCAITMQREKFGRDAMGGWVRMLAHRGKRGRDSGRGLGADGISHKSGAPVRALSGGRRGRHPGPYARRRIVEELGPACHHRKPPGRRRRGRLASARDLGAGRLHADRGRQRACHQSVPLSENPLRHLQGFHADLPAGLLAEHPAGARRLTIQDAGRAAGAGARKTRQPVLRHGRQRHLDASRRRIAEKSCQGRDRRDPLQGWRSCA